MDTRDTPGTHHESLNDESTSGVPEGAVEDNGGTSNPSVVDCGSGVSAISHPAEVIAVGDGGVTNLKIQILSGEGSILCNQHGHFTFFLGR